MLHLAHEGVDPATLDDVEPVCDAATLLGGRALVDQTLVSDELVAYVAHIVQATRYVPLVAVGASPRAAVHLLAATKAQARLVGRAFATPDDVAAVAEPVLAHRLVLQPEAEFEHVPAAAAVQAAVQSVAVPR